MRLAAAIFLVLTPAAVGRAQPSPQPSAGDIAQARALFTTGVELLRDRRWHEGCDVLARSNALVETAQTHSNLAVCSGELGRSLDQAEHLRAFLRLAGPTIDQAMIDRARGELEAITPSIPTVVLRVEPADAQGVELSLDGERVPPEVWIVPRPVNPGEVVVVAGGDAWLEWRETLTLRPGEQQTVQVRLRPRTLPAAPDPSPPSAPPAEAEGGDDAGLWIAIVTIAAVVLAGGAVATYFLATAGGGRADVPLDVDWRRDALIRF